MRSKTVSPARLSARSVSMALIDTHLGPSSSLESRLYSVTHPCIGPGRVSTTQKYPSNPANGMYSSMKELAGVPAGCAAAFVLTLSGSPAAKPSQPLHLHRRSPWDF